MKTLDPAQTFAQLSREDKVRFLSRLAWELTVVARDSYEPGTEQLLHPARVRAVNELQHSLLGYLVALTNDDTHRYPDDVLVAILLEEDRDAQLRQQVAYAFDRAFAFLTA